MVQLHGVGIGCAYHSGSILTTVGSCGRGVSLGPPWESEFIRGDGGRRINFQAKGRAPDCRWDYGCRDSAGSRGDFTQRLGLRFEHSKLQVVENVVEDSR